MIDNKIYKIQSLGKCNGCIFRYKEENNFKDIEIIKSTTNCLSKYKVHYCSLFTTMDKPVVLSAIELELLKLKG